MGEGVKRRGGKTPEAGEGETREPPDEKGEGVEHTSAPSSPLPLPHSFDFPPCFDRREQSHNFLCSFLRANHGTYRPWLDFHGIAWRTNVAATYECTKDGKYGDLLFSHSGFSFPPPPSTLYPGTRRRLLSPPLPAREREKRKRKELLSPAVRQMMDHRQRQNFFSQKRQLFFLPPPSFFC